MPPTRLRASSLSDLLDCPQRWYAKQVLGKSFPFSSRAELGTSIHAATAAYDRSVLLGEDPSPALDNALGVFHDTFRQVESQWKADPSNADFPYRTADNTGHALVTRYCLEVAPQFKYRYVELTLKHLDVEVDGVEIRLTGSTDRVAETPEGLGIVDLKSGKSRVNSSSEVITKDKAQLGIYTLLAEQSIGERVSGPAFIVGLDTSNQKVAVSQPISGARDLLVGEPGKPGLLHVAGMYLKTGIFPPNPSSRLCSRQYCPHYDDCNAHD